jgi:predicted dehydrogenase
MKRIGVGIIGASPINPGWAVSAHIPAIKSLSSHELIAVSTNRRESVDAAVKAFGVTAAFDNSLDLISHSGVDLVVVAVKVPNHYELAFAALDARKRVFCEWPLCTNLADAVRLGRRAEAVGVRTVIGLQARFSPAIWRTRDLIAGGFIGEVLATTVVGSGHAWGPNTDRNHAYLYYSKNGANTLTVPVMHALDALTFVLGDFSSVSAALAARRTKVHVVDETKDIPVTARDQVAICGTSRSDLPGFGFTEVPDERHYKYTFDALAESITAFTDALSLKRYALYVFDYGAPTGFRLAMARPERVTAIVSQNGNAYEEGLGDAWAPIRRYWSEPSAENRETLRKALSPEGIRREYSSGMPNPDVIAPEGYTLDAALIARPGNMDIQLDLFLDYANNVKLYPAFRDYFRKAQPLLLAIWGSPIRISFRRARRPSGETTQTQQFDGSIRGILRWKHTWKRPPMR